jgi:uncharacterized caspase-like protein
VTPRIHRFHLICLFALLLGGRPVSAAPGAAAAVPIESSHQYALCIGINYKNAADIPHLDHAESDAQAVADLLRQHFRFQPDSQVTLLLGAAATRDRILSSLSELLEKLQPEDTLLIYYSGHGTQHQFAADDSEGFMIPADGRLHLPSTHDAYDASLLSMRKLAARIRDTKNGRHIILLLDCCFSGFAATPRGVEDDSAREYRQLMTNPSRIAITAGTEDQESIEISSGPGAGHGAFTAGLLDALNKRVNDHAPASATELFLDLRKEVVTLAQQNQWELSPQLRPLNADKGEIVFLPDTAKDWDNRIATVPASTSNEEMQNAIVNAKSANDQGEDLQRDPAARQQYQQYNERAAAGDTNAMAILHYYNRYGIGTRRNPDKAYVWAANTADTGVPIGNLLLSECFSNGLGVPQDPAAAEKLKQPAGPRAVAAFANIGSKKKASPADLMALGQAAVVFSQNDEGHAPRTVLDKELRRSISYLVDRRNVVKEDLDDIDKNNDWRELPKHLDEWKSAIDEMDAAGKSTPYAADVSAIAVDLRKVIGNMRLKADDTLKVATRKEFDKSAQRIDDLQHLGATKSDTPKP